MSNTDSFIDEVNEEFRKEQILGMLRKYGWIGALVIIGIIGGAVYSEYRKANLASAAAAAGDALTAALEADTAPERAAALGAVADTHDATVFLAELARATELAQSGQQEAAQEALASAIASAPNAPAYQDLLVLKGVVLVGTSADPEAVISELEALTVAGRPYRLLALEQIGYAQIAMDDIDAALATFVSIAQDAEVSDGLQGRAEQMIVALGGDRDGA
ncbi:MAG: hypothetical protein AAFR98_09325 [Pseudomonadota bacterium]